jgi:predicted alpha/beta-hydrolase family hydrolase
MAPETGVAPFVEEAADGPAVRGFLHRPARPSGDALVLAHGAGTSCTAPLLVRVARAFADEGLTVLRCDLPFRQARPTGPPSPAAAPADREGLVRAVHALRRVVRGRVFLGGHSYGGRQATHAAATDPALTPGLLLLAYPLHPPRRPAALRTAHFPALQTPALFVHGDRDPFGSLDEVRAALAVVRAPTVLLAVDGAGHDLRPRGGDDVAASVVKAFLALVN